MESPKAQDDIPKILILPEEASPESRVCTLAHPRASTPSRYYFDPHKGVYEFTRIAAPNSTCRSWLIGRQTRIVASKIEGSTGETLSTAEKLEDRTTGEQLLDDLPNLAHSDSRPISDGYVVKTAELLIATPIDYLFLLLPSFTCQTSTTSPSSKRLFLSAEDLLDKLAENSKQLNQIFSHETMRLAMEQRMQAVCDTVDAGDEKMYRLNDEKLLAELVLKARYMVEIGLPDSMEERFVRKALETPIMILKHEESSSSENASSQNDKSTSQSASTGALNSQSSTASLESASSGLSMTTEVTVPEDQSPAIDEHELHHLLRLRTALSYMILSYIPVGLAVALEALISSGESSIDFKILDEHLAGIAKLRAEALASRSLGDFSRKRSMYEEDEAAEGRAEKKKKKEEQDKKKKAGETRGIRDLKKVDTKGMKKMSDFFGKGAMNKKK